jgi:uncharacterized protein YraI
VPSRVWRYGVVGVALIVLAGGCGGASKHQTAPSTTRITVAPTTTLPGVQTSGPRTVLSPVGINMRAGAGRAAPVIGTAAWGSVLTVLGHTAVRGGWFWVRGASHTGWISSDPTLSAAGEFLPYTSNTFTALYPPAWAHKASRPTEVVFTSSSGTDSIVATTATTASQLAEGRTGYGEAGRRTMVVCGVTSDLVTYAHAGSTSSETYLLQIRLVLDPHHALGFDANLSDLGQPLQVFSNFLDSVRFPFPPCVGR